MVDYHLILFIMGHVGINPAHLTERIDLHMPSAMEGASMSFHPDNPEVATILAAEEALAAAHLTLDLVTIDRLLHPAYIIVQLGGTIEDKAQTLASFTTGDRYWELAQSDEMTVRLFGDTAIVTGRWRGRGRNGAEQFDYQARFLSTWVRDAGEWRNIAYMATEISDA
jgi:ketosteroid isomerase-like protein